MTKKLPLWILIVSGLLALMELAVGAQLAFAPETVLETVNLKATGVDSVVQMWAARQIALGVIFAFATIKRSASMLFITYLFFLVMMLGDLCIGIAHKENPLIIASAVMTVASSVMLFVLNKKK